MEDGDIAQLISLYRKEKDLWCASSLDYYKFDKRQEAYERIYLSLGGEFSVDDIKRKIETLRAQYGRELTKTVQASRDGGDTQEEVYTGLWRFFHPLDSFLRRVYNPRRKSASESVAKTDCDNTKRTKKESPPSPSPPPLPAAVSSTAHEASPTLLRDRMPTTSASASPPESASASASSPSPSSASPSSASASSSAAPPSDPGSSAPSGKAGKKCKPLPPKMEVVMDRAVQVLQQFCEQRKAQPRPAPQPAHDDDNDDEDELFGQTVAKRLKRIHDPEEKLFLKYTIDSVLLRHTHRQRRADVMFRYHPGQM